MTKYIIHLFCAVVLAITTWIAVGPSVYENSGIAALIAVCLFTGFIEFLGYLSYREFERNGSYAHLAIASAILLASATLTFWGGKVLEDFTYRAYEKEIAQKEQSVNRALNSEYNRALKDWKEQKRVFESTRTEKQARLDAEYNKRLNEIMWPAEVALYKQGKTKSLRSHQSSSVRERIAKADKVHGWYTSELEALGAFSIPHPVRERADLESERDSAAQLASIAKNSVRAFDLVLVALVIFLIVSALTEEGDEYIPENSVSEGLLKAIIRAKDGLGIQLAGSDYYEHEERRAVYEEGLRQGASQSEALSEALRSAKHSSEALRQEVLRKAKHIEALERELAKHSQNSQGADKQEDTAKSEAHRSTEAKHSEARSEACEAIDTDMGWIVRTPEGDFTKTKVRTNWRMAKNAWLKSGTEERKATAMKWWSRWLVLAQAEGFQVSRADREVMDGLKMKVA